MLPQPHPNASDLHHNPTQSQPNGNNPLTTSPPAPSQNARTSAPRSPALPHPPPPTPPSHRPEEAQQHPPRHQIRKPPHHIHQRRRLPYPRRRRKRRWERCPANPLHKVGHPVRQECPTQKLQHIEIPSHQRDSQSLLSALLRMQHPFPRLVFLDRQRNAIHGQWHLLSPLIRVIRPHNPLHQ